MASSVTSEYLVPPRPSLSWIKLLSYTLIYLAAALVGELYDTVPTGFTSLWPASGIFLAALLTSARKDWTVFCVIFGLIQLAIEHAGVDRSLTASMGYSLLLVLEALVGALLIIRYLGRSPDFSQMKDVLALMFISCFLVIPSLGIPAKIGRASCRERV